MPFGLSAGTLALLGAGAGLVGGAAKSAGEGAKADRDRTLASATQRYSPWTGLQAKAPEDPDTFGNLATGAVGGAMAGQKFGQANANAANIAAPVQPAQAPAASLLPNAYGKNPFGLG